MNKSDCIVFDNVSISYGAEQAVCDVSFSVRTGEVFAIVGESGSGKSTLIRAAFGILKKATISGQILLNGADVTTLSDKDWRQMRGMSTSMIFQNPSAYLNPARTVENHFKDLLRAHDEPYDVNRVLHMLQLVHLTEGERILQSYPFQLSGGMQQRLAIALSLILKPDIVFADNDPTTEGIKRRRKIVFNTTALTNSTDSWNWNWEISEIRDPDNILLNAETMLLANGTGGGWLYFYYKANATEGSKATLVLHNTNGDNPDVEIELTVPDDASTTA